MNRMPMWRDMQSNYERQKALLKRKLAERRQQIAQQQQQSRQNYGDGYYQDGYRY